MKYYIAWIGFGIVTNERGQCVVFPSWTGALLM